MPRRSLRALALALLLGVAAQYLFFRQPLGLNLFIVTALLLAEAVTLRTPGVRLRWSDLWLPAAALAFAALCAVRVDAPLVAFDVLAAVSLAVASIAALSGLGVSGLGIGGLIGEGFALVGRAAIGAGEALGVAWPSMRSVPKRFARASGLLGGIGLAAPFVVVFAVLFSSADAVFARSLTQLLDLDRIAAFLSDAPGRLFIAVAVAWPAAGLFTALWRTPRGYAVSATRALIAVDTATVALVLIDALFAGFVALQLAYLFGGRDTLDASGVTYASYARRGFFELIAVVALVGALLFGLELTVGRRRRPYLVAAFALVALTTVVLVSAAFRLDLYQRVYGWSELRFYAFAAIAFLGCALAIFAWAVARGRMAHVIQPLTAAGLAVALAANVIGPAAFIARANLDRFIDPSGLPDDAIRSLDVHTLWCLGDGAIPEMVARLDELPSRERVLVVDHLRQALRWRNVDGAVDWRGWNFDRERARAELVRWRDASREATGGRR